MLFSYCFILFLFTCVMQMVDAIHSKRGYNEPNALYNKKPKMDEATNTKIKCSQCRFHNAVINCCGCQTSMCDHGTFACKCFRCNRSICIHCAQFDIGSIDINENSWLCVVCFRDMKQLLITLSSIRSSLLSSSTYPSKSTP